MRILFVQYGNYAESYARFANGGPETFRDQKASVDFVSDLSKSHDVTIVAICDARHDMRLTPKLRSIGVHYDDLVSTRISQIFDEMDPDLLICRTPHRLVLGEAARRRIKTLPHFADIFDGTGLRHAYRMARLRRVLRQLQAPCVANHARNASISVNQALRSPTTRIVPWDRRAIKIDLPAKTGVHDPRSPRLIFAGALSAAKGLGDAIAAVGLLSSRGLRARLTVAGQGDWTPWREQIAKAGLDEQVHYAGLIPNTQMVAEMNDHDMVLVPSRREYPEGLPNTLREGLQSRSVVVASDHPAFADRLQAAHGAMVFRASDPSALADAVEQLCQKPELYVTLSMNAPDAAEGLRFGMYWDDLWTAFIEDPDNQSGWVEQNSLERLLETEAA